MVWERTQQAIQDLVDTAPKSKRYYSDAFDAYYRLWYHMGQYEVSQGKTDTYSVEAGNAELRHYLARLARSTRCFSRLSSFNFLIRPQKEIGWKFTPRTISILSKANLTILPAS